jgi:phage terminase Nu1 subunit (DNA packaging protein)
VARTIRAGMLRLPRRVAARLPHLTPQDVCELDREIRAVLTELVDKSGLPHDTGGQ